MKKIILLLFLFFAAAKTFAQCNCSAEFDHIKNFMETNYVGFKDKIRIMPRPVYDKKVAALEKWLYRKDTQGNCLLIIENYLSIFRDAHISISSNFDALKYDSAYIFSRVRYSLSDQKLESLKNSKGIEGIYYFRSDSTYKIAVIKNPTLLRDYVGVIIESKSPYWQRGMIKFEAKEQPDKALKGVLYMRNHMPSVNWFQPGENTIGGDWQREGTTSKPFIASGNNERVSSKKLSDKTLYIKIASFSPSVAPKIDSVIKANKDLLDSLPYLVLDLRNNGGGADFAYESLLPYIATGPIKGIGVDVLATDSVIAGWARLLDDDDLPEASKTSVRRMVAQMNEGKGKMVNIVEDEIDSSYKTSLFPKKVVVLVNEYCASTTEQFLFAAKQSSKVIIAGNHTEGVLDYSNVRHSNFSCMPYTLGYSTTRSRRIEAGQAIDNVGIKPDVYLSKNGDWVEEARKLLEK